MFTNELDAAQAAIEKEIEAKALEILRKGDASSSWEARSIAHRIVTKRRQQNFSKAFDRLSEGPLS